jgi:hypothetical protein
VETGQGHRLAAGFFGILGAATLISLATAIVLSRAGPLEELAVAFLYGASALMTAYGLWYKTRLALIAYVSWCLTIAVFMAAVIYHEPALLDPWLVPGFLGAIAALYFGWRAILRTCSDAA